MYRRTCPIKYHETYTRLVSLSQSEGRLFVLFPLPFNSLLAIQYSEGEEEEEKREHRFTRIKIPSGALMRTRPMDQTAGAFSF